LKVLFLQEVTGTAKPGDVKEVSPGFARNYLFPKHLAVVAAGEGGRLFGSVTNADIAQQLKREAGIDVDKRRIEVEPPIRSLGPHEVTLNLHAEVTATLRVVVAAK
jgi:large subunit ribosomal protein L9